MSTAGRTERRRECTGPHRVPGPRVPPMTAPEAAGGARPDMVGKALRLLERLPETSTDDLGMPELAMSLVTDLAAAYRVTSEVTPTSRCGPCVNDPLVTSTV